MIPKPPLWEHYSPRERYGWYEEQINTISTIWADSCVVSFNVGIDRAAEVAKSYEPKCDTCPSGVTNAILKLRERRGS